MSQYVERARAIVGARFRLQGRIVEHGLDCVGVLLCVFDIDASDIRRNYRLRGDHREELQAELSRYFRRIPARSRRAGDVMLLAVSRDQFHLGVRTERGFVHADAAVGRVVETPGEPRWPIVGIYRKRRKPRVGK